MSPKKLGPDSLELLLSFVLPAGCRSSLVSGSTYRIQCPNYDIAHRVWENRVGCVYPLLGEGEVLEVVASDYYARSYPKH
ncbi:hypothetical protein [Aphanothece sacrum]|uniref:Uncharacterized protein n=1 Tax=Aphanothece sacrum FPU1 TaxID=1920663 RepID=A0A401IN07_APHSA|nr:hypothetical protein [Aphanothece sacrum]GBF82650.1 hypothetical protein AsFPU1_4081 [Aphanothece sacrum FPU1]GBF86169.1 hypothetical protein AsFPU3_3239 [Aphanothece sacrum FPU3]